MATQPKPRSIFWVATTHALTAGFAVPLFASLIGIVVANMLSDSDGKSFVPFYIYLVIVAFGYAGGVWYSLGYLKKTATIANPQAAVIPSTIAFAIFLTAWGGINVFRVGLEPLPTALIGILYITILVTFYAQTKRAFATWR